MRMMQTIKFQEDFKNQNKNEKEVINSMKRKMTILMLFIMLVITVLVAQTPAYAVVNCAAATSADADSDGYTDIEECAGLTLLDGTVVPNCGAGTGPVGCLNPDAKDLFVIIVPATPSSLLPSNPLAYLSALGITTHTITVAQAGTDRSITSSQKAVKVTESLDTSETILGIANYGTPNGLDLATIFTARIKNFVTSKCTAAGITTCKEYYTGLTVMDDIINHYMKNTIAHEIGHITSLTSTYNSRFGGYHYKTGSGVVMEQSCEYTSKVSTVTFYIPSVYASSDPAAAKLY